MINGERILREKYPDLEEEQYQPAGIDLTLNKVQRVGSFGKPYGLFKDGKELPQLVDVSPKEIKYRGEDIEVFYLNPRTTYIAVTNEMVNIAEDSAQIYLPRSSLLRANIDVRTALGDPAFNGHLSFLIINYNSFPFALEKNVRFAQLVDLKVDGIMSKYDGDYNESD